MTEEPNAAVTVQRPSGDIPFPLGPALVVVGAKFFTGKAMIVVNRIRETLDASTMRCFRGPVYPGSLVGASIGVVNRYAPLRGH